MKLLFNSMVSTPGAKCMIGNLKDFYLGMPMPTANYALIGIPVAILPQEIIDHYNLTPLIHEGHVEICHGMYRLPQAGKLANVQLQQFLAPHGYHPCPFTPRLWTHGPHMTSSSPWLLMALPSSTPTLMT